MNNMPDLSALEALVTGEESEERSQQMQLAFTHFFLKIVQEKEISILVVNEIMALAEATKYASDEELMEEDGIPAEFIQEYREHMERLLELVSELAQKLLLIDHETTGMTLQ